MIAKRFLIILIIVSICFSVLFPTPFEKVSYATDAENLEEQYGDLSTMNKDQEGEDDSLISKIFTWLILSVNLGIYTMTAAIMERPVTYETIIFNQIPSLTLNIFKNSNKSLNTYVHSPGQGARKSIGDYMNDVFKFFSSIAIIVYMVILVYMGIRILLGAGAQKGAKYKELIIYWVQGVAILFLFPYVMKYTIELNDMFVQFIYTNKNITFDAVGQNTAMPKTPSTIGKTPFSALNSATINSIVYLLDENNTDFMSKMFRVAWNNGWIIYAVCWGVMVKQVLALVIIYFRRLLTIIFLVSIFPLVTISYAIDKIGDGKSQAFGNWYKEFLMNVMVNSFHAVVYVLGMALILKLGNSNWFLTVMLIGFIAKGDEVLRGIFGIKGGGGDTVKGIGKTMLAAKGAESLLKDTRKFADKIAGSDSHLAKGASAARGMMASHYNNKTQDNIAKMRNMDLADANAERITQEQELARIQEEMQQQEADRLAELYAQANGMTPEQISTAIDTLKNGENEEDRIKAAETLATAMNAQDPAVQAALMRELQNGLTDEQRELISALAQTMGRNVQVNFNEDIELILKGIKKKKRVKDGSEFGTLKDSLADNAAALALARRYGLNKKEDIEKLEKLSNIKFRDPSKLKRVKPTKKVSGRRGQRYQGTFKNIPAIRNRDEAARQARMTKGQRFKMSAATRAARLNRSIKNLPERVKEVPKQTWRQVRNTAGDVKNATLRGLSNKKRSIKSQVDKIRNGPRTIKNATYGRVKKFGSELRQDFKDGSIKGYMQNTKEILKDQMIVAGKELHTGLSSIRHWKSGPNDYRDAKFSAAVQRLKDKGVILRPPKFASRVETGKSILRATGRTIMNTPNYVVDGLGNALVQGAENMYDARENRRIRKAGERATKNAVRELAMRKAVEREARRLRGEAQESETQMPPNSTKDSSVANRFKADLDNVQNQKFSQMYKDAKLMLNNPEEYRRQKDSELFINKFSSLEGFEGYRANGENAFGPAPNASARSGFYATQQVGETIVPGAGQNLRGRNSNQQTRNGLNANRYNSNDRTRPKDFVFRNGNETYDGNVLVVNSESDRRKAQSMFNEINGIGRNARNTGTNTGNGTQQRMNSTEQAQADRLQSLAQSIVAINSPENYTASEMVAHIDNARAMIKAIEKENRQINKTDLEAGKMYAEQLETLKGKLDYDLDQFDSTLRIQVINDPSLIADNDPNRRKILDSSISRVQSMSDGDVLLSMLNYDKDDLRPGYEPGTPIERGETAVESRIRELTEARDSALEASEDARKEFLNFAEEFRKEAIGVVSDYTIGAPVSIAAGLVTMGVSSSSGDGDVFSFDSLNAGLAGVALGDKAYGKVKEVASEVAKGGKAVAGAVAKEVSNNAKESTVAPPPEIDYKKPIITEFTVRESSTEGQVLVTVRVEPGSYDIMRYSFKSFDGDVVSEGEAAEGQLTFNAKVERGTKMRFEVYDGKVTVTSDITAV